MNKIYAALPPFAIALIITFLVTPFVIRLAKRVGAVDVPKDNRRVHKVPIPRLGGLAIYIGFMISILMSIKISNQLFGILIAATLIVILGYFDDKKPLKAKLKFIVQIIAASIVIYYGVKINRVTNPMHFIAGGKRWIELGIWSYPLTLVWIVGVTNAINLIDGLDGLAAGVSSISAVSLFFVALIAKQPQIGLLMSAVLAGATIGFLPYNFNPAKIFMGDTGALFLGFMLATISVVGVVKSYAALAILVPIFAIGIPIFDTLFAMLRRFLNGKSMMEADKGHLHHRLLDIGLSQKQAVLTLYLVSAVLGFSAVALVEVTLKVAIALVFAVFLLVSMGVKYLGLMNIKESDNNIDA